MVVVRICFKRIIYNMKVQINTNNETFRVDFNKPIDLSLTSKVKNSFKAWYVDEIKIKTIKSDGFIGSVREGGSVNFKELLINPHGNMTHTESVGHISKENIYVNKTLQSFHFISQVITVVPQKESFIAENGNNETDLVIGVNQIKNKILPNIEAVILRSQTQFEKLAFKTYHYTNWPYLKQETAAYLRNFGIKHLLIDQPSIDKEFDQGKLLAHKAFWNYPNEIDQKRTITELIGIPNHVKDGKYLLNISLANIENDASPSRPIIYELF